MDPPSQQLVERLQAFKLCRPGDLRRCRPLVRRLARDLPTFDSVWIDALVQTRRLTPFQARILDSPHPDRLGVGPFVLIDALGDDGRLSRFLARERDGKARYVLSQARCRNEHPSTALDRVQKFIHATSGMREHSLSQLLGCALQEDLVTVVSLHVPGPTLAELLIRRGRFPASIVHDIASLLAGALGNLEACQVVHGDIRLQNIVLSRGGRAVLLHPGLLAAVDPELTIHADLPPDAYDTVAPERIGTGTPASISSDMYGLGCLLFELTAGRPPFLQGDPLTKLAAHLSQSVPDVRRFAPDTPDATAELLNRLTAHDPDLRPPSFTQVFRELKRRGTRKRLRRFEATFQHPVRIRRSAPRTSRAKRAIVPLLVLFAAAHLALLHAGARTELLSIANTFTRTIRDAIQQDAPPGTTGDSTAGGSALHEITLRPFPTDIVDGVLTLDGPGPYAAGRLAAVGPLVVRGDSEQRPVIVVKDEPLELWAEQIVLENLVIRSQGPETSRTTLLTVNCQNIGLRNCSIQCPAGDPDVAALTWTALDETSASLPRIAVVNCLFAGTGSSLQLHSFPESVMIQNVLQLSGGALIEFSGQRGPQRTIDVALQHATLRESRGLLRLAAVTPLDGSPPVTLTLENSVFDLIPDHSGLILFSDAPQTDWPTRIRITGQDSLIRPGTTLAAVMENARARAIPLDADQMSVDGLFSAQFSFAGESVTNPAHAVVSGSQLIGHTLTPPGADAAAFSADGSPAYNSESTH